MSGWFVIAQSLILTLPALIAAVYGRQNKRSLQTGNEKTVGEMVTEVHGVESKQETAYETHFPDTTGRG